MASASGTRPHTAAQKAPAGVVAAAAATVLIVAGTYVSALLAPREQRNALRQKLSSAETRGVLAG